MLRSEERKDMPNTAEMLQTLRAIMADDVGPLPAHRLSWSARFRVSATLTPRSARGRSAWPSRLT